MKIIEAIFSILAIVGSFLVANQFFWGWYLYLASSSLGTYWGFKTKNYYFAAMQGFFVITNIIAIVNYCW